MNAKIDRVALISDEPSIDYAQWLSQILDIPIHLDYEVDTQDISPSYLLRISNNRLKLEFSAVKRAPFIPMISPGRPAKGADPLLRSIGMKHGTVIDMTAGWCVDAARVALSGCRITAFENDPLVYVLSHNAFEHCRIPEIHQRLELLYGDSTQILQSQHFEADVIYMDPMYPTRKRGAASPKGIALLRELVGKAKTDNSCDKMFDAAMSIKRRRVVVKRPRQAPAIHKARVGKILSKQVRYDIYFSG